jgi:hypothetical protein
MFYNEGPRRHNGQETNGTLILYVVIFFSLFIGLSMIRHNIFLGNTDNIYHGKWPEFELAFCTLYDSFTMIPTVTWNFTVMICAAIAIVSPYQVNGINRAIVMPLMLLYIFSLVGRTQEERPSLPFPSARIYQGTNPHSNTPPASRTKLSISL